MTSPNAPPVYVTYQVRFCIQAQTLGGPVLNEALRIGQRLNFC